MQAIKMILTYDILPDVQDRYYQFMLGEMVPTLQSMGLMMGGAWHTAYGAYPMRLVEFIAESRATLDNVLSTPAFDRLEGELQRFVTNYRRKTVPLRDNIFQF
jgi:hypothetical protein